MPKQTSSSEEWPLFEVVTVPEACELWDKPRNTLMYAIDASTGKENDLVFRKSGSTWLITVRSLIRRWGWPEKRNSA